MGYFKVYTLQWEKYVRLNDDLLKNNRWRKTLKRSYSLSNFV